MEMDFVEARQVLITGVMAGMVQLMEKKVPEKGIFRPAILALVYPGSVHEGRLYVQYSADHGCGIRASMIVEGTDRELSNYVFFGRRQECVGWLQDESHVEELIGIYNHLTQKADHMD